MNNFTLPIFYAGNIGYYQYISNAHSIVLDRHSNYQKQTFRNRCTIYGANGPLNLIVPIVHGKGKKVLEGKVRIDYSENWQKVHWKSLVSCYRSSPYFEYYEADLQKHYKRAPAKLLEFTYPLHQQIMAWLKLETPEQFTGRYMPQGDKREDLRRAFEMKTRLMQHTDTFKAYPQVFMDKFGFISNLSCYDLLFNCGPEAANYL